MLLITNKDCQQFNFCLTVYDTDVDGSDKIRKDWLIIPVNIGVMESHIHPGSR